MAAFEERISIDGSPPYTSDGSGGTNGGPNAADFQGPKNTWKILKMKHECYEAQVLDVKKECLLFEGGFQMNEPEIAKLFCPQMKSEEDSSIYKERVASASYVPTFGKLITGLISNLFSEDLAVMEAVDHDDPETAGSEFTPLLRDYYKLFEVDCDGAGSNLHNFFRDRTTKALTHSFTYFGVDYPKGEADNLLDQERQGLDKPRLYKIAADAIFDWKMQEEKPHEYEWLKLVYCQPVQATPFDPPMHQFFVKCWSLRDGIAVYECFQSEPLPLGKQPKDKDLLKKIDEGETSFKRIPIFCFKLDDGVSVGAKLAPMAAEHFNRTTIENHSTNKACLTIPVVYRGEMLPDGGGLPDPIAADMRRGQHPRGKVNNKGVVELGSHTQDRFEIVEAKGGALNFIHKQNEDLDEKMHSVVHQMGQSLKQARSKSGKSAMSKQEDRRSTEMLLTAISDEVHNIVKRVMYCISESRGEDIVWEVKGLSAIQQEEREDLIMEAQLLMTMNFPSLTQQKEHYYRVGSRLIEGVGEETMRTIRMELEESLNKKWKNSGQSQAEGEPQPDPATGQLPGVSQPKQLPGQSAPKQLTAGSKAVSQPGPPATPPLGPAGQALMPDGSHLQTGQHVDGSVVFKQLAEDYQDKDIQFVKHIPWMGPVEVPLSSIDFSNKDNWQASAEPDKVDKFAEKMSQDSFNKPIILVNNPSNDNKMMVIDGHHRALGALQNGTPVNAFVGHIGSDEGPWDKLHSKQVGSKQASEQKEASNQSDKSAEAIGGKTK